MNSKGSSVLIVDQCFLSSPPLLKDEGSLRMTANTFGEAVCTLSVVLCKVCVLITRELGPRYISLPTTEEEMDQLPSVCLHRWTHSHKATWQKSS